MSDGAALDAREERFCRDYVRRPVGKFAAKFAGYDPSDLEEAAYRLLAREDIQDRIATLRHQLAWRQCHDADAMLAHFSSSVSDDFMVIFKHDPEHRIRKLLNDASCKFQ